MDEAGTELQGSETLTIDDDRMQLVRNEVGQTVAAGGTHVGQERKNNEDSVLVVGSKERNGRNGLYVVADGVGGANAGEVASGAVVTVLGDEYQENQEALGAIDRGDWLRQGVETANQKVCTQNEGREGDRRMGTTVVAALVEGDTAHIANVGDSRAYDIGPETIEQITEDHSLMARMLAQGAITPEQAETHPYRNVILRSIGAKEEVEVDIFEWKIQPEHCLLLCSDGLAGVVADEELARIVREAADPQAAVKELIKQANDNGGPDNIAAIVVA